METIKQNNASVETTKFGINKLNQRLLDTNHKEQKPIENYKPKNNVTTEKTINSNDTLSEGKNVINNWLDETKNIYIGMYENQLKNRYDIYNTLFSSFLNSKNNWNPDANYSDMLFKNNTFIKSMETAMNGINDGRSYYDELGKTIDNMLKQMVELDHNLFTLFNKEVQLTETDWNRTAEKFQKAVENRINASRGIIKKNMEILNERLNKK